MIVIDRIYPIILLTVMFTISAIMSGCGLEENEPEPEPRPKPEIEYDEVIQTTVGDTFQISLEANPSTGYSWKSEFDSEFIKENEKEYVSEPSQDPPVVGSPGTEVFTFQALKQGITQITLTYKREWETESLEQHIVKVEISPT